MAVRRISSSPLDATPSSKRTRKEVQGDEARRPEIHPHLYHHNHSSASFNSLPMDVIILIFEYLPQYPRLRVLKFVCKRWHSAAYKSITFLRSDDFAWNWKFVLPRLPALSMIQVSDLAEKIELPEVLPRLTSFLTRHGMSTCFCRYIEQASSLTSLVINQMSKTCPPLDRIISNSLDSITSLSLAAYSSLSLHLPRLSRLRIAPTTGHDIVVRHASQLTRLECNFLSFPRKVTYPVLRFLELSADSSCDMSFLANCPALTRLTLEVPLSTLSASVSPPPVHLLPYITTLFSAFPVSLPLVAPMLAGATRLVSLSIVKLIDASAMLPFASRLITLHMVGSWQENVAATLFHCTALQELHISHCHFEEIYDGRSLSFPHLTIIEWDLRCYVASAACLHMEKLFRAAPHLQHVSVTLPLFGDHLASLFSMLQLAEKTGVVFMQLSLAQSDVNELEHGKRWRDQFNWLSLSVAAWDGFVINASF